MKSIHIIYGLLVIAVASASCGGGNDSAVKRVELNPAEAVEVRIDSAGLLHLESSDSSLLYDVCGIEHVGGRYVIHSRDLMRIFDAENGRSLGNLAQAGHGVGQYSYISGFRRSGDTLLIYDCNTGAEYSYLADGTFLGERRPFGTGPRFKGMPLGVNTYFISPDDDGYYCINNFVGGIAEATPAYTRYTRDGEAVGFVDGRGLRCGAFLTDRGFTDREHGRVLVWEALKDTLFDIAGDRVEAVYDFDFGDNSLPAHIQALPELTERIAAFTAEGADYISLLRYFQTKGDNIYFSISHGGKYSDYVRYNETDGNSRILRFVDPEGRYSPSGFLKLDGDTAIIALSDQLNPELNPALYRFHVSLFE